MIQSTIQPIKPTLAAAPVPSAAPPPQQPAPMLNVSPETQEALKKLAEGVGAMGAGLAGARPPIDKNSPEYKQAVMQQLAYSTPTGGAMAAVGDTLSFFGNQYQQQQKQKQADMAAWMPTVTVGE